MLPRREKIVLFCLKILRNKMHTFVRVLELELIQTQMTQTPMLRAEVYASACRNRQTVYRLHSITNQKTLCHFKESTFTFRLMRGKVLHFPRKDI